MPYFASDRSFELHALIHYVISSYRVCPLYLKDHSVGPPISIFSPNSVVTLEVLTVIVKAGCPIGGSHIRGRLIRCHLRYIHSPRNLQSASRLRRLAELGGLARVYFSTALSSWCLAHFWTWWSLFVAGARIRLFEAGAGAALL